MPKYTYLVSLCDPEAAVSVDALRAIVSRLRARPVVNARELLWTVEREHEVELGARYEIEAQIAHLPPGVPKLTMVALPSD